MDRFNYIFLTNMNSAERIENVKLQWEKIRHITKDESPNIFSAIMAKSITAVELYDNVQFPTYLTPGEVGCAKSHLAIWRDFLKSEESILFVFEDDCNIVSENFTEEAVQDIENFFASIDHPAIVLLQGDKKQGSKVYTGKSILVQRGLECACTHGYVINRAAAKGLLEFQNPIKFEIDLFKAYYWFDVLTPYILKESMVNTNTVVEYVDSINDMGNRLYSKERRKVQEMKYGLLYKDLTFSNKLRFHTRRLLKNVVKIKKRF